MFLYANYEILALVLVSHDVDEVPALMPVTRTATNFPFWEFASFRVVCVAREIFLQELGTTDLATVTAFEHEYHW